MRVIDFFDKSAARFPERPFLADAGGARTYRQVQIDSHRIANALLREGMAPGFKAAIYSDNALRPFDCVMGVMRAGGIWVPVNARNTAEESVFALNNTETEILFYSDKFKELVPTFRRLCPQLRLFICIEGPDGASPSLDDFIAETADLSPDVDRVSDDVVTLFSSGGTTGAPKGVMMAHRAWETMIANVMCTQPHKKPVHLVAAPMTHSAGGSMLVMAAMGATNVMLPGFEPEEVMKAIEHFGVTHLFLPPTAIYRMLSHPRVRDYDYSSLRYFTYASAPMVPARVKEAVEVFGPVMMSSFGQTEAGLCVTIFSPEEHSAVLAVGDDRRLASCGRAAPFMCIEIMDDDGNILPAEAQGEIVLRGNQLMTGYYKNPEETERTRKNGWHRTGDVGFKDAEGWIYLIDRKREMIITGGFNVFPAEIERVIGGHAAVQDCAVIGVPDEDWGELVTAVVELKVGREASEAELIGFTRAQLNAVKTPKRVVFWPDLPRSSAGKVLRREVRDKFWLEKDRAI